jgi:hypothetical protein
MLLVRVPADDVAMTTSTRTPSDSIDECVLDGADLFVEDRFSARAKVAAEAGRTVVVSIPDVPAGRLTGTSYALLHVFVEGRLRAALQRAGFSRVDRRCDADGRVACLVATK